jgi:DNA-binding FadR family transcriptional regulator
MKTLKRKQLIYQVVQEEIKSYIVQNSLKPDDPLPPETEVAEQLGVSRNSVREAVKSLESLGIIEARPGAGLFVKDFSFSHLLDNMAYGMLFDIRQLSDILEVRFHLEYGMIQKAIGGVTPVQLERLHDLLRQMKSVAEAGGYSAEYDRAFHQILWENCGNALVGKIVDIFWGVFQQAQQRADIPPPVDPIDTYQRHVDITAALAQKDVPALQAAMVGHYIGIQTRLEQLQDTLAT